MSSTPPRPIGSRWSSSRATAARREWTLRRGGRSRRATGRHVRGPRRAPRRRRDDADRQPAGLGAARWSRASASAPSCCRAPSSCARRTCALRLRVAAAGARAGGRAQRAASWRRRDRRCPVLTIPDEALYAAEPAPRRRAGPARPVPDHLHERHLRRAEGGAARAALPRPASACRRSTGSTRARATSSGAPPRRGWSKSARNVFIAPWMRGAAALLHDARFDPHERLELLEREQVNVLCMAPTEYRVIAKRAEPRPVAVAARAGRGRRGAEPRGAARLPRGDRAVDPRRLRPDGDRPDDRRAARRGDPRPARWAAPLPGVDAADRGRRAGRATRRPCRRSSCGYLGDDPPRPSVRAVAHRRPRAPGRGRLPLLRGPRRRRDHLRRLPDRPVRGRVARSSRTRRWRRPRSSPRRTTSAARSCAPSSCCATAASRPTRSSRELQDHVKADDRALQVPPPHRVRGGPAEDRQRQGPPRAAARAGLRRPTRPRPARRAASLAEQRDDRCRGEHHATVALALLQQPLGRQPAKRVHGCLMRDAVTARHLTRTQNRRSDQLTRDPLRDT